MDRYFGSIKDGFAILDDGNSHHLFDVKRANIGENVEIVDNGVVALCEITCLLPETLKVLSCSKTEKKPSKLILAFSLLKGDHTDLVLEKGTELGVNEFVPFLSSRTIVRLDEKEKEKKLTRYRKICENASLQCKRGDVPTIKKIYSFEETLLVPSDKKIFAYEGMAGSNETLAVAFKDLVPGDSVLSLIGPEGGFSDEEATKAKACGFNFVSLGSSILRAETASLYVCSTFSYESEK